MNAPFLTREIDVRPRVSFCHRPVTVLLEQKRAELNEAPQIFARRLFDGESHWPENNYRRIVNFEVDFPKAKLPVAAELLGIPLETLRTI